MIDWFLKKGYTVFLQVQFFNLYGSQGKHFRWKIKSIHSFTQEMSTRA